MAVPVEVADEDELEEALDWLEQLAVADGVSLEDVPLDSTPLAETPDDDLEETLDWLEQQLAAGEETPPMIVESAEAEVEVAAEEAPEPDTVAAIEEDALLDFAAQMPDDPDAMLAWLEELAASKETPAVEEVVLVVDEVAEAEPAVSPDIVEVVTMPKEEQVTVMDAEADLAMDFLIEMPEDPDAAIAWLERLAARQGAPLEELPSLTDDAEEVVALESVAEETAMVEAEVDRGEMAEASDEPIESPESALVDTVPDEIALELDEELGEATLEWMAFDVEEQAQSDWLEALPESDIASWLAAEEATAAGTGPLPALDFEQTLVGSGSRPPLAPEPAVEVEAGPTAEPMIKPEPEREADTLIIPRTERTTSVFTLDKDRLATARQALTTRDYDTAMSAYHSLIETGQGLGTLIVELETATDQYPQQPLLRRLLGDAYMRNGQLQRALDTYRQALDQM
jgi:tetratricopeptide (TPR) repeat protein